MSGKSINYKVLLVFAPVLVLIGISGFVIPPEKSFTSGATGYNVFHIVSGAVGFVVLLLKNENYIRGFNIGFGLLDLYQALASSLNLFPERYFRWTGVDDVLHVAVGAALVFIGLYGYKNRT